MIVQLLKQIKLCPVPQYVTQMTGSLENKLEKVTVEEPWIRYAHSYSTTTCFKVYAPVAFLIFLFY